LIGRQELRTRLTVQVELQALHRTVSRPVDRRRFSCGEGESHSRQVPAGSHLLVGGNRGARLGAFRQVRRSGSGGSSAERRGTISKRRSGGGNRSRRFLKGGHSRPGGKAAHRLYGQGISSLVHFISTSCSRPQPRAAPIASTASNGSTTGALGGLRRHVSRSHSGSGRSAKRSSLRSYLSSR
jgi:hypothetical protein